MIIVEAMSVKEAIVNFKNGYSYSQAILMAYCEEYGISKNDAKKIARCFGGGMGRTCQTCGAVTGAFIVLGLKNDDIDNTLAKNKTYEEVQVFADKFKRKFKSINCRELLNCDLGTNEGQRFYKENNLNDHCEKLVKYAAELLED